MGKKSKIAAAEPEVADAMTDEAFDGIEIGADAQFMEPPSDLRKKVRQRASKAGDKDPVKEAEAALARMATSFDAWMSEESQRLSMLWSAADLTDFETEARDTFYRAAHDIKGQAATMGFPVAGRIAGSLCRLLDGIDEVSMMPRELVRQHVQSVRAVIVENAREDTSPTAQLLAERLDEVTDDFLDRVVKAA
ncbi:MAG: Hpt domain-containing protein [Siculibacillus sp.]|nr:Hpt domain-containing protein [Siculibacillus sp.]